MSFRMSAAAQQASYAALSRRAAAAYPLSPVINKSVRHASFTARARAAIARAAIAPLVPSSANIAPVESASASASTIPPYPAKFEWSKITLASMWTKARELGPAAVGVYFVLWLVPVSGTYGLIMNDVVDVICPLVAIDTYAPTFFADGVRSTLELLNIPIPPKGEALPKHVTGFLWGLIATDLIEPLRIMATLYATPKLLNAWRARSLTSS